MRIDTHVHIGTFQSIEDSGDLLKTRPDVAAFRTRYPRLYEAFANEEPQDNSTKLISIMDKYDVERSLIQPRPGVTNEDVAEIAKRHPSRLIPLALPTPWPVPGDNVPKTEDHTLPVKTADNLEYCFTKLGMRAAGEFYVRRVTASAHPEQIADDFSPSMEILKRFGAPLQIPTAWTQFPGGLYYGDPIWVDELATRYPTVPIILTKMGRGLERYFEGCLIVGLRNDNVYFDTSNTVPAHLTEILDRLGPNRLLFGTDWSATWQYLENPGSVHQTAIDTVTAATSDKSIVKAIMSENASRIFYDAISSDMSFVAP